MSRPGVTYEDVEKAANFILSEYKKVPTIKEVRDYMGGGSFTTISRHLAAWRNESLPPENKSSKKSIRSAKRQKDLDLHYQAGYNCGYQKAYAENLQKYTESIRVFDKISQSFFDYLEKMEKKNV